ncbi:hypothetical protein Vse01_44540 [Micromonospora sediminimaris]|uniref:Uncharacterized protein n=1 Tax=Micromonospora sediminimaris TaxID=547162 RepID=A0A9W5UVH8_9ACTN|nr:hypothetical protein Vse01_44540 [Micromonospora sediminimaris]
MTPGRRHGQAWPAADIQPRARRCPRSYVRWHGEQFLDARGDGRRLRWYPDWVYRYWRDNRLAPHVRPPEQS